MDWGHLSASPLRTVRSYRVDDARLRVCSPEEIKTILDAATGDLRFLARLTLESLPRLSEALNLQRDDIGPASITIVRSKSGKARRVPVTPELRADLLTRCHAKGFIFGVGNEGQPPQAAAISVAFPRLASSLGLNGISHHTFRHTGATVMVANGVSLRAVQVIGGWSSLRMVERYAHVDDTELQRAVRTTQTHGDAAIKAPTKTPTSEKTAQATPNGSNSAKS